ncbi:MAG: 50S ribosomal protein L9 [Sphingobacteriales bacterium 17-39-43]|jgi:large subunit ribosomal protein L9|uniref:50S ribosomal protein L9 n=1 Tax=Daejeonella sp. TaxID=2805397 RepID=UPI000BC71E43|nr:50S ribosomal protein L9 [Daejeonella sp.]MCF8452974.1 50S ribosomal protein L9 [Pedobacter sp.]OYZ31416.1 MAG: 50S ribosomal protein L9 [Sphingobacteriales bacterium 16-39-50]OZA24246.1 MAG: 50S ribosomal protein L9 [Sphingobacteriales bacterium 17-39-43]OZA59027.1 MAG: 50S ribosomal protein L9 [Sphingobacteriales bacterium 39-40-5]HQS52854.1 50S ribosomal protein L9 [Daejeonella sp.]
MELILKQDIKNLGEKDDVVNVKPGFGRNYLIPKGYATLATESAKKVLAENLKQAAFKQDKIKKDADAIAARLEGVKLSIGAKAGESGKIFGSVNTIQIADALKKEGFDVDRRRITFDTEPKFVGEYTANLNLHKEVKVKVPFEVIAE